MNLTDNEVMEYIETSNFAPATQRSEAARLRSVLSLLDGRPERLWAGIQKLAPYSRSTTWTRVTAFWDWLISHNQGAVTPNPYGEWRRKNARLFRNAYVRRTPNIDFAEARRRIETLPPGTRTRALEILYSGMRWTESATRQGNEVVGKGSKVREVYVPAGLGPDFCQSYSTFVRHLKSVGLKPHDLRKLALSELVENGANEFELKEVAGWATLAPALSYVRVRRPRIAALMKKVSGG